MLPKAAESASRRFSLPSQ